MHSLTTGARWHSAILSTVVLSVTLGIGNMASAQARRGPADGIPGKPESQQSDFDAYAKDLGYGNAPGSIRFDGDLKCPDQTKCGNQPAVTFTITPADYVDDWDGAISGNKNGHIVAKVFKVGSQPFDYWNLTATDALSYLWIGQFQGGKGAALYAMRNGKLKRIYTFAGLKKCTNTPKPPEVHINMPATCTDPIGVIPQSNVQLASLSTQHFMPQFDRSQGGSLNGLWVSCSAGCCEVQYSLQ